MQLDCFFSYVTKGQWPKEPPLPVPRTRFTPAEPEYIIEWAASYLDILSVELQKKDFVHQMLCWPFMEDVGRVYRTEESLRFDGSRFMEFGPNSGIQDRVPLDVILDPIHHQARDFSARASLVAHTLRHISLSNKAGEFDTSLKNFHHWKLLMGTTRPYGDLWRGGSARHARLGLSLRALVEGLLTSPFFYELANFLPEKSPHKSNLLSFPSVNTYTHSHTFEGNYLGMISGWKSDSLMEFRVICSFSEVPAAALTLEEALASGVYRKRDPHPLLKYHDGHLERHLIFQRNPEEESGYEKSAISYVGPSGLPIFIP